MYTGYVFDVDGTLLDSNAVWCGVGERYLFDRGYKAEDDLDKKMSIMSLTQSANYLKKQYGIQDDVQTIIFDLCAYVREQYLYHLGVKEGVKEYLEYLYKNGKRLCVLSATDAHLITSALQRCGIAHYFSMILTCEMAGFDKRDPRLYAWTMQKLNTRKEDTIFIEDAYHAIAALHENSYHVYAVYDKANDRKWKDIKKIADHSFLSMKEMLNA